MAGWVQEQDGDEIEEGTNGACFPAFQGYLQKNDGGYLQVWHKRLCRITEGNLKFGRRSDAKPLGQIEITHDTKVLHVGGSFFSLQAPPSKGGNKAVQHEFDASSEDEALLWMKKLKSTVEMKEQMHQALMEADRLRMEAQKQRDLLARLAAEEEARLRAAAQAAARGKGNGNEEDDEAARRAAEEAETERLRLLAEEEENRKAAEAEAAVKAAEKEAEKKRKEDEKKKQEEDDLARIKKKSPVKEKKPLPNFDLPKKT